MSVLSSGLRKQLESGVLAARRVAELGSRAAIESLGVFSDRKPDHVTGDAAGLRNGLRAKWRQVGLVNDLLVAECAFEQWHRLLFARFLAENGLLLHPDLNIPVSLEECEELAGELGEPDGWSVAALFASRILPGIFRLDDPCVRVRLAPEHRVGLEEILAGLPVEVFTADDSLGWVYQYWQKDSKDEVNASERKVGGADLGPVTQLFTENYMVRFLLENSLGAWWAARHPHSPLLTSWEYLRFNDDGSPAAGSFDGWPGSVAEVTVMDPCCGSGHFLVDAFGMLWRMRAEEEGLSPVEAQDAVLRDNLFGLELDPRCVQIAMFAVAFQAWKDGGGWRQLPVPNIACSGIPVKTPLKEWTALANGDERLESALAKLHQLFRDADTLGSLINPRSVVEGGSQLSLDDVEWKRVLPILEVASSGSKVDSATHALSATAAGVARAARLLGGSYTLTATNVPYLGRGKQGPLLQHFLSANYPLGVADLATSFIERFTTWTSAGGSFAIVTSQNWFFSSTYRRLRELLLGSQSFTALAELGSRSFSSQLYEFPVALVVASNKAEVNSQVLAIACGTPRSASETAEALRATPCGRVSQADWLKDRGLVISVRGPAAGLRLEDVAQVHAGLQHGDKPRFVRFHWEQLLHEKWSRQVSAVSPSQTYAGRDEVVFWENGAGDLARHPSAVLRGAGAWGRSGVAVARMGALASTVYCGEIFDQNCAAVIPDSEADLVALWCFLSSPDYSDSVRAVDKRAGVAPSSLGMVSIDLDHWRSVAAEQYPAGLPEPSSNDPTQWLFKGRPEVSAAPLQVAVGRLLGFRWPHQPDEDDLDQFADADGIVCLPSVAGEAPAHEQLADLLAAAYGTAWNAGTLSKLLADVGSKKKSLADWLRDEFFKQHCALFGNRPFVWHVWDGHPQGFSALVNYHRLDRKTLEKLTYTYLGTDWIERQRAAVRDEEPGAEARLSAAEGLKKKLELILEGEAPYDIYVRWKPLEEQPLGWDPDLDDGVRLNIRPFVEARVLRSSFNIHWKKDRGTNPDGSERLNDIHLNLTEKQLPRKKGR